MSKTKRTEYALELRRLGIHTHKVRGVQKDENDALIRLVDALAGFVRDVLDANTADGKVLFERAIKRQIIVEE